MGLDEFTSGSTATASTTTTQTQSPANQEEESDNQPTEDDGYFKVVGKQGKRKVFETEEDWEEAAEFMREEMELNPNEVLNMPASKRHDILHRAILQLDSMDKEPFHPTRTCIVCDETFTFPSNWNFTRFKGEPVCNDHEIKDVVQSYEQMNALAGTQWD